MSLHHIRKGLDLPLAGAPVQHIAPAQPVSQVATLGADLHGLRPALAVQVGDRVRRGQLLYADRRRPECRVTAAAAGTVRAIHRGERRAFVSLVIDIADNDGVQASVDFANLPRDLAHADAAALRALLVESGLWCALRGRPYGHVPEIDAQPQALFVTAIDTRAHAPDPQVVLAGREADFAAGLAALERIVAPEVPVYLCVAAGSAIAAGAGSRAARHEFAGPHPAGLPGLHIHQLHPVGAARSVWHIGYADVAAIGRLLNTGRLDVERVISLAGPAVKSPRLLRTRLGASVGELCRGELLQGELRVLSGSALDGRRAMDEADAFLGRFHAQVCALVEGRERELFGWITPQRAKYSVWNVVAGRFAALRPTGGLPLSTSTNGGERAMVPIGSFERVLPMDIMATHLLRALITGNAERAVALGALELEEEDLALATFVCPGKTEYGPLLRQMLDRVEKEGV